MANSSILIPGNQNYSNNISSVQEEEKYLIKDNFLSEYETEGEKSAVRGQLEVPHINSVYTKPDADNKIALAVSDLERKILSKEDPYKIIPQVKEMISSMVKTDGSTPFELPQSGVDPQKDSHLTTKKYVDKLNKEHLIANDPHDILRQVRNLLQQYTKVSDTYTKDKLYTVKEITDLLKLYLKADGSTPFKKAQLGMDPELDSHLSTKRYVDKIMTTHRMEVDPHNFLSTLNDRLSAYIKKKDVYDKTQTYSRTQLDSVINKLVESSVDNEIQNYQNQINYLIQSIQNEHYIKQDGSIPFIEPQKGVEGIDDNDLVTLSQLYKLKENIQEESPKWKTSGPVKTTVGFIEDNTQLPEVMSMQEVFDAIFYGNSISITCPSMTTIAETCPITLCIYNSIGLVDSAELYQQGKLIYTFSKDQFEQECITVDSEIISKDTEFIFKVYYSTGAIQEQSASTQVALPVFVGLLPKWKFANTITMDYLKELQLQDIQGTQNRFVVKGNNDDSISFFYKFEDSNLRHPFIILPVNYPNLKGISTSVQEFGIEAFDVIDLIPLHIEGIEDDMVFKIYVYRQALSSLNQSITYNFK